MRRLAPLALLAITLVACNRSGTDPEVFSPSSIPVSELRDYAFDFQRDCFCTAESRTPVRITVRNRAVVEVRSKKTGAMLANLADWPTIEEIYRQVDAAIEAGESVHIDHDEDGYPTLIQIGSLAADAGVNYHIGQFTRL